MVNPNSDFCPLELHDSESVLFSDTKYVVICYSSYNPGRSPFYQPAALLKLWSTYPAGCWEEGKTES